MRDALNRRFDVVLAESLDRFSRDQEDTAGLFKRLTFAGVNIVTLAEGDITHLHIGFKGTMNALFLKDLAEKTHRGLRGRVEDGKSAGGLCYGYRVVKALNAGTVTTGEREIDPARGRGRRAHLPRLRRGRVAEADREEPESRRRRRVRSAAPGVRARSTATRKRGTGILNNELYVGRLVWNRLRYVKNPDTGKRVSRLNPTSEWMSKDVPELRIVPDELWTAAKSRQKQTRHAMKTAGAIGVAKRPQYLFSGLTKCGVCGAGFIMSGKNRLGCFGARDQGRCDNHLTIRRDEVEARVLKSAAGQAAAPGSVRGVLRRVHARDEPASDGAPRQPVCSRARDRAHRGQAQEADRDGDERRGASEVKDELNANAAKREELKATLAAADAPPPLLHPEMAGLYRQKVTALAQALEHPETRTEASEALRGLIDAIVLTPDQGELQIELKGNLAAMLGAAQNAKRSPETGDLSLQVVMVAGAGFEPATFGL